MKNSVASFKLLLWLVFGVLLVGTIYFFVSKTDTVTNQKNIELQSTNELKQANDQNTNTLDDVQVSEEITFIGIVTASKDDCKNLGVCSIFVENYEVIWDDSAKTELSGAVESNIRIGDEVQVFGQKISPNIVTLYGDVSYFIKKVGQNPDLTSQDAHASEIRISGEITDVVHCPWDNKCAIFVNGYEVITSIGLSPGPLGQTDGVYAIGDEVEVYAKKESDKVLTLYGSTEYYVKKISTLKPSNQKLPDTLMALCTGENKTTEFTTNDNQSHIFNQPAGGVYACVDNIWKVKEIAVPDSATFFFDKKVELLDICQPLLWRSGCEKYDYIQCETFNYCTNNDD